MECLFDATDGDRKCPSAVGKSDAQFWKPLEHAPEDHRTNRERRLCRHADQPGQPVFRHPFLAQHVPGMNENCGAEFFCCAPNWLERGVVEVQRVSPTGEWTGVHVRADLRAAESELTNTTFQLARSKIDILQRY